MRTRKKLKFDSCKHVILLFRLVNKADMVCKLILLIVSEYEIMLNRKIDVEYIIQFDMHDIE